MRIYAPIKQQSVKDLPGHTKLKFRCEQRVDGQCRLAVLPAAAATCCRLPICASLLLPCCRQPGQNTVDELAAGDMRSKLEEKERKHYLQTKSHNFEGGCRSCPHTGRHLQPTGSSVRTGVAIGFGGSCSCSVLRQGTGLCSRVLLASLTILLQRSETRTCDYWSRRGRQAAAGRAARNARWSPRQQMRTMKTTMQTTVTTVTKTT